MNALESFTWNWTDCILLYFRVGSEGVVGLHKFAILLYFAFFIAFCLRVTHKIFTLLYDPLVQNIIFFFLNRQVLVALALCLAWVGSCCCDSSIWVLKLFVARTKRYNPIALSETLSSYFTSADRQWRHVNSFALLDLFDVSKIFDMSMTRRQGFEALFFQVFRLFKLKRVRVGTNMAFLSLLLFDLRGIKSLIQTQMVAIQAGFSIAYWRVGWHRWAMTSIAQSRQILIWIRRLYHLSLWCCLL